jgi:hypothetical protein
MGKLEHLKIKRCPAAFADFARNINQTVDLLASIQSGPGIDVQVASSPRTIKTPNGKGQPKEQPRGKIMFSIRPSALNGIGVGGTGTGGGNTTQTVGINGLLVDVLQPTSPNAATTYPNILRAGNGNSYVIANSTGLSVVSGSNACSIPFANIARPMTIRTINVCDNGTAKLMDIIASATY